MNRVQGIGDDLLTSKTDFSALTDDGKQNVNPLKRGETADFAGIMDMQMQMSRMNASRLFGTDDIAAASQTASTEASEAVSAYEDDQYSQAIDYQPIDLFA